MKLPDVAVTIWACLIRLFPLQWWETLLNLQSPPKYTGVSTSHQEQLNANTLHTALCNYLDVRMEVHERPLAVFTVDPQGKLHLFVQHNKNSHSLLLSEIKRNTWKAGTSMDIVRFWREEKLRGSKCVVPADGNADWGYLLLIMLFQIHHGDPTAWKDLPAWESSPASREGLSTWVCVGFVVFVWTMPRPIHRSFLQRLLLHTLRGRFCKHDSLLSCSSTQVQRSAASCCPEDSPQLNVSAGWQDWWGHTDIPHLKGMPPTQHQQRGSFCW